MDLNHFDTKTRANNGIEVKLRDLRTGKATDAAIAVLGSDSDTFHVLMAERRRKVSKILEESGAKELSPEEVDRMRCEMLAGLTLGWRGLTKDGKPLAFSRDDAVELYVNYPAIRDQVDNAVADRTLFLLA